MKTAAARQKRTSPPETVGSGKARKLFFASKAASKNTSREDAPASGQPAAAPALRLVHSAAAEPAAVRPDRQQAEQPPPAPALSALSVSVPPAAAPAATPGAEAKPAPPVAAPSAMPQPEAATAARQVPQSPLAADSEASRGRERKPPPARTEAAAPEAADLQLPPPAPAGPAGQVAPSVAADLSGSADVALSRFVDSSPSAIASSLPQLTPALSEKMQAEQQALAAAAPVLTASTAGTAESTTALAAPEVAAAPALELRENTREADPGPLPLPAASAPPPFQGNASGRKALEEDQSGSLWEQFTALLGKLVQSLRVRDDGVDTSAGARPKLALRGQADPARLADSRQQASAALQQQHDAHVHSFRANPGQARIQTRGVNESFPATGAAPAAVELPPQADENAAAYASAPLPQDVRQAADARLAASLAPALGKIRSQTQEAAQSRDSKREEAIADARAETARLNAKADTEQRQLVVERRTKVAKLQAQGIAEVRTEAATFEKESAARNDDARDAIDEHVQAAETKAERAMLEAESKATKEKQEGERRAAQQKQELERAQAKESWWDRTKKAIKRAVQAVSEAIDRIFTAVRQAVALLIDTARALAIGLINAARNWVVAKLELFRSWLKKAVDRYLQERFPALAKRINAAIDELADTAIGAVNAIADTAIESVNALADKLGSLLDDVLARFQTGLKAAVGAVGAALQGDFAGALRIALEAACELAGISSAPVFAFFDRAGQAVLTILKDPVAFIGKLLKATGQGIRSFFGNIGQHLISGVIGWLTGALAQTPLRGPFEFSPRGVLSIVLQVLGLTYANIKTRVIRKVPQAEPVFHLVEKGVALLLRVQAEGPAALWSELKEKLGDLKETVLGAIRNWLSLTAIKQGIIWLLSLTNPASALVKAVKLVFDLVMFLVERYRQIKDFVLSVYAAVNDILADNFAKVSLAVENALAKGLPVLISLFAAVLGLGDIAKQVTKVISTLTAPVNRAIDRVIDRVVRFAKKIIATVRRGAAAVRDTAKKLLTWWKARAGFRDEAGEAHTLSYRGQKNTARLQVASAAPQDIGPFLAACMEKAGQDGRKYTTAQVQAATAFYHKEVKPLEEKLKAADAGTRKDKQQRDTDENRPLVEALQKNLDRFGNKWLARFFDPGDEYDFPPPQLPVMADNVKAQSFRADYIVKNTADNKYKYSITTGTESRSHGGNLAGWAQLQEHKLTVAAQYVRMHLLPHRLGGNAVDSNLTPAPGSRANTPFSSRVEQPAIKAAVEGADKERKPIWYDFQISYHASAAAPESWPAGKPYPATAFPSRIAAEWGFYKARKAGSKTIERDAATMNMGLTLALPQLISGPPAINADGARALHAAIPTVSEYFIREILLEQGKTSAYRNEAEIRTRCEKKGSGLRATMRQQYIDAVIAAINAKQVTLN